MEKIYFPISYSTPIQDFSDLSSYLHYNWTLIVFSSVFFSVDQRNSNLDPPLSHQKVGFFPPLASAEQPGAGCNARDTDGLQGHAAAHGPLEMKMKWGSVVCSTLIRFWPPFQCDPIGLNCFISQPAKSKWVVDVIWLFTGNHPWLIYLLLLGSVWAQCVAGAHKLQRKNLLWLCIVYICCHPIRREAFMKY